MKSNMASKIAAKIFSSFDFPRIMMDIAFFLVQCDQFMNV